MRFLHKIIALAYIKNGTWEVGDNIPNTFNSCKRYDENNVQRTEEILQKQYRLNTVLNNAPL
jgi:hypothetical protein